MYLVNLVRLLLLVGVLYESGVDAAEHQREQPSDLRGTIIALVEKFVEYSKVQLDTEATLALFEPDAQVLMNGFPPFVGHDEIQTVVELFPEKASRIQVNYKEVVPMDEDASYVYGVLQFEFFNDSGDMYVDATQLGIFKKTSDGYKYYIVMVNIHNQSA